MGQKVNEITFFTVPDTGIQLPIRKVSPTLLQELERALRAEMPAPQPPRQAVNYGSGVEYEENAANPEYLEALKNHKEVFNQELSARTQKLMIKRGILPFLSLTDEQVAQVQALRAEMRADFGVDLDGDDKWVFVTSIALGTVEDIGDLTSALVRRSTVTEEAVADALKKF